MSREDEAFEKLDARFSVMIAFFVGLAVGVLIGAIVQALP